MGSSPGRDGSRRQRSALPSRQAAARPWPRRLVATRRDMSGRLSPGPVPSRRRRVVLRDGVAPTAPLAAELQVHVKAQTAPYKYPRVVDFADELPKTASGKVRRAALRG